MIKTMMALAAAGATLTATPALADDWRVISTNNVGTMFQIDYAANWWPVAGGARRVWIRMVYPKPQNGVSYVMALTEFDCANGRSRTVSAAYYNAAGSATDSSGLDNWGYTIPGTAFETVQETVCSWVQR